MNNSLCLTPRTGSTLPYRDRCCSASHRSCLRVPASRRSQQSSGMSAEHGHGVALLDSDGRLSGARPWPHPPRDQRERCSEAAPLIRSSRARASGPKSSAGLDHEGQELSVVAVSDGRILPCVSCLPCQWQWRSLSQAVDGRKRPAGAPPPRPTARAGQGTRSAGQGRRPLPACNPFTSRTACFPVSSTARYRASLTAWWRVLTSR